MLHILYMFTNQLTDTVHAFGGSSVEINGPYYFRIRICGVSFIHPFFVLQNSTQFVAGYDLIHKARLVISSVHNCIWSYYSAPPDMQSVIYTAANSHTRNTTSRRYTQLRRHVSILLIIVTHHSQFLLLYNVVILRQQLLQLIQLLVVLLLTP